MIEELPDYLRPVTWFAYITGWRKREVLKLQWHQVDFDLGEVWTKVEDEKGKKVKRFPFRTLPDLDDLIRTQLASTKSLERDRGKIIPWVFHRCGKQIKSMKTAWKGACRRAGFPDTIFHDLRRCAVMNLERAGVPRTTAKSFTGHKTDSVYERYAIVDRAAQEAGAKRLSDLFREQEKRTVVPIRKASGE